jgi:hypothetical protein
MSCPEIEVISISLECLFEEKNKEKGKNGGGEGFGFTPLS